MEFKIKFINSNLQKETTIINAPGILDAIHQFYIQEGVTNIIKIKRIL